MRLSSQRTGFVGVLCLGILASTSRADDWHGGYGHYPPPGHGAPYPGAFAEHPAYPLGDDPFAPDLHDYGSAPLVASAEQLVVQADMFLRAFVHDARKVPAGRLILADASALREAALRFRQAAADGVDPARIVAEFDHVAACWQRLESRMLFVSRGRVGPNIATALQMGRTVAQMERSLF